MKKRYKLSTGDSFEAEPAELAVVLQQYKDYLNNYLEIYGSLEDDEFVARGNGFCDRKYSDDFIESQISRYQCDIEEVECLMKKK